MRRLGRRFGTGLAALVMLACTASAPAATTIQTEDFKLVSAAGAPADLLGVAVAIDGDVIVIGAALDDEAGGDAGAVHVFRFDGTTWNAETVLTASDASVADRLGASVSISGDVIVAGAVGAGAAYVFRFDGTTWNDEAKLLTSDGNSLGEFGHSASVDGDVAIVGNAAGSAYVFRFDGFDWNEETKLTPSDPGTTGFGASVAISGNVIVVGSIGSAYVYRYDGTAWIEEANLTGGAFSFGLSVGVDGETIVVGDPADASGTAHVFRYAGALWNPEAVLAASDGSTGDSFGESVSVCGDVIAAGAWRDDDAGFISGSAYVFRYDGTGWTEQVKLVASDGGPTDLLGFSVAVCGSVVVGAHGDDNENGVNAGAAYVFSLTTDTDGDGLDDDVELALGTDPNDDDTDDDGLLDGAEIDVADGAGCPSPLVADSDGDGLDDGTEVDGSGTDPCNADSDGDGVADGTDPTPLDPGVPPGFLEELARTLCDSIRDLDLSLFNGPNDNANRGRRNALANRACGAANAIADGDIDDAFDKMSSLLDKVDGVDSPPDWMDGSSEKTALEAEVNLIIGLLLL